MNGLTAWHLLQRAAACLLLVVLSPLLLGVAIAVRLDSAGPAVFRGPRVGRHGVPFHIHKFRTMRWTPGDTGAPLTAARDRRITRLGELLRRTRLDELPQLWDVVRGDMALVGPRPEAPEFVDLADIRWQEILSVLPGMTGPTQLAYRDETRLLPEQGAEIAYRESVLPLKMESDVVYVRTRSWRTDAACCWETVRRRSEARHG